MLTRAKRRARILWHYWQLRRVMQHSRANAETRIYVYTDWVQHFGIHTLPKHHDFMLLPYEVKQQLEEQQEKQADAPKERAVGE